MNLTRPQKILWDEAVFLPLLFSLILGACERTPTPTTASYFEVRDSAGIQLILNGLSVPAETDTLSLRADLHIGAMEGEEPLLFYRIADLAVDFMGNIYVGNGQSGTIRVFSPTGEFLREFGGRGEGPGELTTITDVWITGDSVVVVDQNRARKVILFTKTGDLVSSWRLRLPDSRRLYPQGLGPGGWIGYFLAPALLGIELRPGDTQITDRDLVRLFFPGDSVGEVLVDVPARTFYGSRTMGGPDSGLFAPWPMYGFDAQGNIFLSHGSHYQIDVFTPWGELIRRVRRLYDPIPITEADVQQVVAELPSAVDTMSDISQPYRQSLKERWTQRVADRATFPRPSHRPPVRRLLVSPQGGFWIERIDHLSPAEPEKPRLYASSSMAESPSFWDIFDREGRFRGAARLPMRFTPMAVGEETVVGVQTDSLGVEYVVRFRAEESHSGG